MSEDFPWLLATVMLALGFPAFFTGMLWLLDRATNIDTAKKIKKFREKGNKWDF